MPSPFHLHSRREMRNAIAALTLFLVPLSAQASDWVFDSAHTSAQFAVKHMMVSTVRGAFSKVTGSVHLDDTDVTKSSIEAVIPVDTVMTASMLLLVTSVSSKCTEPVTLLKAPRTVETIMCFTANWALVCAESKTQSEA